MRHAKITKAFQPCFSFYDLRILNDMHYLIASQRKIVICFHFEIDYN